MVRAAGSYPAGRRFDSDRRYQKIISCKADIYNLIKAVTGRKKSSIKRFCYAKDFNLRPHGQAVKTPPFHGGIMGSNPVGVTKQVKGEPVSIRRRIRLYHIL